VRVRRYLAIYVLVVIAMTLVFGLVAAAAGDESPPTIAYVALGPVSALFTHMGLPLFLVWQFFTVPWIVVWASVPRLGVIAMIGLAFSWLGIGWYMSRVF
jgi:hypothetical protein